MVVKRVALIGDAAAAYDPTSPRASLSAGLADAALIAARVADQLDGIVTEDDVARLGEQRRHIALGATRDHQVGRSGIPDVPSSAVRTPST